MPTRYQMNVPQHPDDNYSINKAFDRNYGNRLKSGDTTPLKYTIKDGDGEPLDKDRLVGMETTVKMKHEGVTAYEAEFEATLEEVSEGYEGDLVARCKIMEALPPSDTPYIVEFHFEEADDRFIFPSGNNLPLYITPSSLNSDGEAIKNASEQRLNEIVERKLEENPVLSEAEAKELARQENYQELLDTGVMQTKINERLEDLEEEYAPKLTELTTQLAQNVMMLDGLSGDSIYSTDEMNPVAQPADEPLSIPTYEGSGQVVHPSVIDIPSGFGGFRYWMAMTPYPNGDDGYENPSVVASHDGIEWVVPEGLTNPLMDKPSGTYNFNSDPVLEYAEGKLHLFSRSVDRNFPNEEERIVYMVSDDGVNWTDPVAVLTHPLTDSVVSPAVVKTYDKWYMWGNKTSIKPNKLTRWEAKSPLGPWTNPTICSGYNNETVGNLDLWHMDIKNIGGEYVMLTYESQNGNGIVGGDLRRSVSRDGINWTPDKSPLIRMRTNEWGGSSYKSTFTPTRVNGQDGYRIWYGGVKDYTVYNVGHTIALPYKPSDIISAVHGVNGYVVGDTFNLPDGSIPENLTSGQPWTIRQGSPIIEGGRLKSSDGRSITVGTSISHNVDMEATFPIIPESDTREVYLYARMSQNTSGSAEWIRFGVYGGGGGGSVWNLEKRVGGLLTKIRSTVIPSKNGDRLRLVVNGVSVKCYINGLLIFDEIVNDPALNTIVGIQLYGDKSVDDFTVKAL